MKSIALLFAFLSPIFLIAQGDTDYSDAVRLAEIWLEAQKDYESLPGISLAAVEDQNIIWSAAFGQSNPADNVNMTDETICSICSISKLFTAVAIMNLYEEGKLRLDDRIEDLLPWFDLPQQFDESGPITVRSLLTHSSGLPREGNFSYWSGPDFPFPSREELIEELKNQTTLYPASTYYQYSNLGLSLLGEIVSEVSGMSYDDYVQAEILSPLKLSDTRTELPDDLYGSQLAIGYTARDRNGERLPVKKFQARGIKAAAGYSSTVLDLAEFAKWQFRLLDSNTNEILLPATLKNMQRVHWTDPDFGQTWGLGFVVYKGGDGKRWVTHGGSCPGYRSAFMLQPDSKRGYAVMINASGANPGKYARGLHSLLVKAAGEKQPEENIDMTAYSGLYNVMPWNYENLIVPWYGKLAVISLPEDDPAGEMTLFKHKEGDTFVRVRDDGSDGEELTFIRDANGAVTHMMQHGQRVPKMSNLEDE